MARLAFEDGDEEEKQVEDRVEDDKDPGEPEAEVAMHRAKDAEDEKHEGEFSEEKGEAVHHIAVIGKLSFNEGRLVGMKLWVRWLI